MTKEKFIDAVHLKANGGVLSPDSVIMRVDVEFYLPAAVNFAMTKEYYVNQEEEGNKDVPHTFYTYFNNIPVLYDSTRKNRPYINLPSKLIPTSGDWGLRNVMDNCDNPYTPLNENHLSNLDYWLNILQGEHFYRLEGKQKIWLYNKPKLVEAMNTSFIVAVDDLAPDAELPIPGRGEMEAIQVCVELVTGIRTIAADTKADGRDIN